MNKRNTFFLMTSHSTFCDPPVKMGFIQETTSQVKEQDTDGFSSKCDVTLIGL